MKKKNYKHDYETISRKFLRKIRGILYCCFKDKKTLYPLYASYRHRNKKKSNNAYVIQYMSQEPNYSTGFGHGIDVWRNGIVNAALFDLEYAYTSMVSAEWEKSLGFSENSVSVDGLIRKGYRQVLLPYYDPEQEESISIIREIIDSYSGEKVIFRNEFEQVSRRESFMIGADYMRKKFWESSAREKDQLIYDPNEISVAVHIRRGDVSVELEKGNESMKKRWLDLDYYSTIMNMIDRQNEKKRKLHYYIFSEGNREDFLTLCDDKEMTFCLEMPAVDSFIHMCRADLLVVGLSSFSYDPGLINPALKIASDRFWNPYPENGEWIIADKNGMIAKKEEAKIAEVLSGKK